MSNHLAIATVTAALRKRLESALSSDLTDISVTVSHQRPDGSSNGDPHVNIYLYQTSPNGAQANADLPARNAGGQLTARPTVPLDLHYLLTCYGDETLLVPQRILGSVMRTLESKPVLNRDLIQAVKDDANLSYLSDSDLTQAVETVKFAPEPLSLDELSKLWTVFFQTPYGLSVAYRASVVLLDAAETPRHVLPVAERALTIRPSVKRAPAVSPEEIPGIQLWLTSGGGLSYDHEGVSRWADQSGQDNDAIQPDADRRPQLAARGLGDQPVLRFDGQNDYLALENLQYSSPGQIPEITVCALVRSKSEDRQIIVSFDSDNYWRLALRDGVGQNVGWDTTDSTGTSRNLRSDDRYHDGRWHLVCGWFLAGADPDKRLFVDGTEVKHATSHGGIALGTTPAITRFGFIGVGSEADVLDGNRAPHWYLNGDLAELLMYDRALSDAERGGVEQYFVDRYRS